MIVKKGFTVFVLYPSISLPMMSPNVLVIQSSSVLALIFEYRILFHVALERQITLHFYRFQSSVAVPEMGEFWTFKFCLFSCNCKKKSVDLLCCVPISLFSIRCKARYKNCIQYSLMWPIGIT